MDNCRCLCSAVRARKKGRKEMFYLSTGARCSSVVRAFAHGAIGRGIDPS